MLTIIELQFNFEEMTDMLPDDNQTLLPYTRCTEGQASTRVIYHTTWISKTKKSRS